MQINNNINQTDNLSQTSENIITTPNNGGLGKVISYLSLITGLLGIALLIIAPVVMIFPPLVMGTLSVAAVFLGFFGLLLKGNKKVILTGLIMGIVGLIILFVFMSLAEARRKVIDENNQNQVLNEVPLEQSSENTFSSKAFTSVEGKFQINFPDGWQLTQQGSGQAVVLELSEDQTNEVIINVASVVGTMSISELVNSTLNNIKRSGYVITEEKNSKIQLEGGEGVLLTITAEDSGEVYLQTHLLVVGDNGRIYQFTGTAPKPREEARKIFEASFLTFKILE